MSAVRFIKKPSTKYAYLYFYDIETAFNFQRDNPDVYLTYIFSTEVSPAKWEAKWVLLQ